MATNTKTSFQYDGRVGALYRIWIANIFLTILTLGIYSFWGKTRMRKYIAQSFALLQDRFEYTGTGMEIFLGFLKALPVIILIYAPIVIWKPEEHPIVNLIFIPIIYLVYVAIYGALRYRLSRTTWRGVRGALSGSGFRYAAIALLRIPLNIITLGLMIPASNIKTYRYIIEHTHFGSAQASFDGNAGALFKVNLVTLLLAIPTLGLSRIWYAAAELQHHYNHTTIGGIRLASTHTGGSMLGLIIGNILIMVLTLGLGTPIVIQRNLKYFTDNLYILGDIETSGIMQSGHERPATGEGLDGAMGLDSGFI